MFGSILSKIFGSRNEREIKRIRETLAQINNLEESIQQLDDSALQNKTVEFKERIEKGENLDAILPEAFAVTREVGKRVLNMRHFDEQIIGGIALHEGKISEMKTGEGKTLVATLPVYLNALTGKGAHVVTVNDYLATRDAEWMGKIYNFLGLSIGVVINDMEEDDRQTAYNADITYGTNNEFGFDYLRDNMKFEITHCVQRELNYALVDEVDSILIDESRTPLIISGRAEESTEKYTTINRLVPGLLKRDTYYTLDEKARSVSLTDAGITKAEELIKVENLYDPKNVDTLHHLNQAMKAHVLFKIDVDYVVKDDEVLIVDEFTGRLMPGRRYSDGLHQALEAKEGVTIENENQTLASITFQNYFRLYDKLSGMTGTADTEAAEFQDIYKLEVLSIPTHRDMVRDDMSDLIYRTTEEKYEAIIDDIAVAHEKGEPILAGTISIENSELISRMLKKRGIKHNVLNAKHHEQEAEIVAQAGRKGAITIATNMAGRGTDIVLGGNAEKLVEAEGIDPLDQTAWNARLDELTKQCEAEKFEVLEAGGLKIIGSERHESRRIDNQLRGRSGRQGDNGASRFYISLEDDLMRIFGSEKISSFMEKLGMERGQPIEHKMVSRAIESAQKRVEGHNFDMRKHLLEYDDVMNKQREVIYQQRRDILEGVDLKEEVIDMAIMTAENMVFEHTPENSHPEEWDLEGLVNGLTLKLGLRAYLDKNKNLKIGDKDLSFETVLPDDIIEAVEEEVKNRYEEQEKTIGAEKLRDLERYIMLTTLDSMWKDNLLNMDYLKDAVGFRGYAQKDPLNEYKKEGHELFTDMISRFKEEVGSLLLRVKIEEGTESSLTLEQREQNVIEHRGETEIQEPQTVRRVTKKVGRNDPCPCGSGKKFKKCHGATAKS